MSVLGQDHDFDALDIAIIFDGSHAQARVCIASEAPILPCFLAHQEQAAGSAQKEKVTLVTLPPLIGLTRARDRGNGEMPSQASPISRADGRQRGVSLCNRVLCSYAGRQFRAVRGLGRTGAEFQHIRHCARPMPSTRRIGRSSFPKR